VLPSRSRLTSWNPESLPASAKSISHAGESIYRNVRDLDDNCDRMPEARAWSGAAHDAAAQMFGRATTSASHLLDYTDVVADALNYGRSTIGKARADLLREADAIDNGELHVDDKWVVLIKPAAMTAEHAADLQKQAQAAQAEINTLLCAVGVADDGTTQRLLVAMATKGAEFKVQPMGPPCPEPADPFDEVPNPSTEAGRTLQELVRDQDMSTTVRETSETTDREGNHFKTLMMLDGSKQVIKEEGSSLPSAHVLPPGSLEVTQYDRNGNVVSVAQAIEGEDGTQTTSIWWTDGTSVTMTRTPDGKCSGGVVTAERKHGILPDDFFADPIPTVAGGALTGLEKQAQRGIPGLSAHALENVGAGAKFGGPALGVVTALYNVATAETKHDACVAAWSGGVGLALGIGADVGLTAMGMGPIGAAVLTTGGGFAFGYLGGIVGELVCPP
jgi:hypothetical protein